MFKAFKKKGLIKELDTQYFMMSISLREWVYFTELYLSGDARYDKKYLLRKMKHASNEFTIREKLVNNILKELGELN